jgi:hypothetical protein
VATLLADLFSTVGRPLKAMALGRLKDLQLSAPERLYQGPATGFMLPWLPQASA